jgi:hypothetical protein
VQGLRQQVVPVPWDALAWLLRLGLAGVLLYASADKILHPQDFVGIVKDYHILPDALVNVTAIWLPWFELLLGLCLFAGWLSDGALALATLLLAAFWTVLLVNYFRGINVGCGCFTSTPEEAAPMLWYVARDSFLLALALTAVEARRRAGRAAAAARAA